MCAKKEQQIIKDLLTWYSNNARELPWRYAHHEAGNPYHTWLSEVMLQQTTVVTVKDYFRDFIARWPTLTDLAACEEDNILTAWQGLGYYSRARNLLKCAKVIAEHHRGAFPQSTKELLKLPGVGPYTAAAISSIAFQQKEVPVDGNVIRVMARLYGLKTPLPDLKSDIENLVVRYKNNPRPGDFAQGLMDLGATVCKPRKPLCETCPLQKNCVSFAQKWQHDIPYKKEKPPKPTRYGKAFLITDSKGKMLLQKRPEKGLLANMMEVPSTCWSTDYDDVQKSFEDLCGEGKITPFEVTVKHTFTHFHLELEVFYGGPRDFTKRCKSAQWISPSDLPQHPLPTLMKKIINVNI